ncbi:extracellular calcium-sensing receptor-like protein [Labeo rohita]|uniref:Extracellular calcium-sensing receptor-like protein n=1 Tax=Labeo rohita TaxID=84645 RepID=A0A498MV64_LABRO|nr:extracellular calcium-sensing receptor-like protein [Labeo rohita]
MSASNSHFLDEELVEPAMLPGPPQDVLSSLSNADGSSGGSVLSSGAGQSSTDDILSILQMAVARLGLDNSVQPAQTNVFFKQNVDSMFTMPPCKDFVAEFASALTGSNVPKRRSKTARTPASMAEADSIGVGRAPEIEQPVAALVVSPDEALRGNVCCPSAQCGRTDTLLKKAYESVAYITRAENTICQLLLACNTTLESANVDSSAAQFLQTALLTLGHVTRELGTLSATLLTARRQVWLAQARLPEDSFHGFGLELSKMTDGLV